MSPEEFAATHLGSSQDRPGQLRDRSAASTPFSHGAVQSTPDHVDWVEQGAVTPVKNQQMVSPPPPLPPGFFCYLNTQIHPVVCPPVMLLRILMPHSAAAQMLD